LEHFSLDIWVFSAIIKTSVEDGYFCVNTKASGLGEVQPLKAVFGAPHEAGRFV
jgi:hypothetical protein